MRVFGNFASKSCFKTFVVEGLFFCFRKIILGVIFLKKGSVFVLGSFLSRGFLFGTLFFRERFLLKFFFFKFVFF